MTVTRDQIVAEARSWIGVPWSHKGRTRFGLDCVGLVVAVCKALGLSDYDNLDYDRDPDPSTYLGHFLAGGAVRINPIVAQDGDLVAFHQSGFPCHCGILATMYSQRSVIHAHMRRRSVIEEIVRPEAPIASCYRLPGVEA